MLLASKREVSTKNSLNALKKIWVFPENMKIVEGLRRKIVERFRIRTLKMAVFPLIYRGLDGHDHARCYDLKG